MYLPWLASTDFSSQTCVHPIVLALSEVEHDISIHLYQFAESMYTITVSKDSSLHLECLRFLARNQSIHKPIEYAHSFPTASIDCYIFFCPLKFHLLSFKHPRAFSKEFENALEEAKSVAKQTYVLIIAYIITDPQQYDGKKYI